jgi:hypothetical protein
MRAAPVAIPKQRKIQVFYFIIFYFLLSCVAFRQQICGAIYYSGFTIYNLRKRLWH